MKYRTRLYVILVSIALISSLSGLLLAFLQTRRLFLYEYRSKAMSIASTTAALLDPTPLKTINTPEDANLPKYTEFRDLLRAARDHNQRQDVFVTFIYTLKPSPQDPSKLVLAVSAANTPEETIPIGAVYESSVDKELVKHLTKNYSPKEFVIDRWGSWLSAYSPIYDEQGKYVATLGIDINAKDIEYELDHLLMLSIYSLLGALGLAFLCAFTLAKQMTLSLNVINHAVSDISKGHFEVRPKLKTHDEFHDLAVAISQMTEGLEQREHLKKNFARYVSSHVLEKTLELTSPITLEGERKKITVLFSDIRDFNQITEKYPAEEVMNILNSYFTKMLEIIFEYNGTLDKFLWDGIMVEFGAPEDDLEQEKHAILAAIAMKKELAILCETWKKEGKPTLDIGIGVHTGLAVVGTVGSEKRMEYTAIGDTVNVASRLQALSKEKGTTILCSEETYMPIRNEFSFSSLGEVQLHGRTDPIKTYSLNI